MLTENGLQYDLVGTIHHKPSGTDSGHYTSICHSLQSQSHRWFNYDDHEVSISRFTSLKNDRVLKSHTKSVTVLFYVSEELRTHNGQALIDIQSDASESEVIDQVGEGEDVLNQPHHLKVSVIIPFHKVKKGKGKTTLNQPHHLKVSVIIAFHKNFYNESKATTAQYVRSNIS
jgi:hypothetical protein